MKRISYILAFVLLFSFGAVAQDCVISIESITNFDTGLNMFKAGKVHRVDLRMTAGCESSGSFNVTNGYEVYSTDGATVLGFTAGIYPAFTDIDWEFDNWSYFAKPFESTVPVVTNPTGEYILNPGLVFPIDGPNSVAAAFGGVWSSFSDPTRGFPAGYDEVAYYIEFTTQEADTNLTVCIDSTFTPPGGSWKWAALDAPGGDVIPQWYASAQCYTLYKSPNDPPEFVPSTPTALTFDHCVLATYDFDATDPTPPEDGGPDVVTYTVEDGPGTIDAATGVWTWNTLPQSGVVSLTIGATDLAGSGATTEAVVELTITNAPPTITCPAEVISAPEGVQKKHTVTTTTDCDVVTVTAAGSDAVVDNGDGTFDVFYTAPALGTTRTECLTVVVDDGELTDECDVCFFVTPGSPYAVTIEKDEGEDWCEADNGFGALQGQFTNVTVFLDAIDAANGIGGFNFLFAYDASALSFQEANEYFDCGGGLYDTYNWEYFTYRHGADGNCAGSGCPTGLVRVVGIAETNNGAVHPDTVVLAEGDDPLPMFDLKFLVSNDRNLECQYAPVRFFWYECQDNTISNITGSELYVSGQIFEFENDDNIANGGVGFPTYLGAQDFCLENLLKPDVVAIRNIDFRNGGVDIACAEEIDARGDINLNGVANEIADAVMFTNYFIDGLSAFEPYIDGAIAASDVNADGLPLTVADLVYLIRVVIGDAAAYDKAVVNGKVTVSDVVNVNVPVAAAYIVFENEVDVTNLTDMPMMTGFRGGNTHVLLADVNGNVTTVVGDLVQANANVLDIQMATYDGAEVVSKIVPGSFSLAQNYPNPFNPTATIKFAIPGGGAYEVVFYNVTGQVVDRISGTTEGFGEVVWDAGDLASGIYFYKLVSENGYTDTKKAVLLK